MVSSPTPDGRQISKAQGRRPRTAPCAFFERLYVFVMVIYMAQMTPGAGRMVGRLSGDPVPLLVPIVMTLVLLVRHPVSFLHRRLWLFAGIMLCWTVAVCYKLHDFSSTHLSFYFFLFYAIFVAFIHVRVFGHELLRMYERIMVILSAVSLVLWGLAVLLPDSGSFLFRMFPQTSFGNNVLYLFNWMDPLKGQTYGSLIRNAGCSWEPGRFAIMLVAAIQVNLSRCGIRFRRNKSILCLLLALATTVSTTGYSIVLLLYALYSLRRRKLSNVLTFLFVVLPVSWYVFSFDFMGDKIRDRADFDGLTREQMEGLDYRAQEHGDEYVGSLDRFESMYFEWLNYQNDPLLGYGRDNDYSWFRQDITTNYALSGGLVKILSQYGIFVGVLLYAILFYSSWRISRTCRYSQPLAVAIVLLLSSVSYPVFCIPVYTAFWLYGLFCREADEGE